MGAEMGVMMKLTLLDTASAPLKAFTAALETLQSSVINISGKLSKTAEGIAAIGAAASAAAPLTGFAAAMDALGASLGLVKANSSGVAGTLGTIGERAGAAAVGTERLDATILGLNAALQGLATHVGAAVAGLGALGGAARTAGTGATGAMNNIGAGAQNANQHVTTLADSIKGMAALWAAFKIEKGLKESVIDAAEYERTDNRLRNLNLPADESAMIHKAVRDTGASFHQFNQNELLEMSIDLRNATGSAHEAATGLKGFAEAVFAINLSMPSGKKLDQQGQLNLAKYLEGRGVTQDPAAMERELDAVTKIVAATQGRVNPNNLFGNLSYAKGGLGQTMDDAARTAFAAMTEQDSIGGGTGGKIGTMLTSFVNSITKANAITTKNRDEWLKLGLVDPSKVNVNENTNHVTSIQAGAIAGTEIVGKNFKQWVDTYLRPALIAQGVDMNDITAIKSKTDVLFPNRNASEAAFELLARKSLIEKDMANIDQAAGKKKQVDNGLDLAAAQWERFHKAIDDLSNKIGTTLLPILNSLIEKFTVWIEELTQFTTAHPIFGFILGLGAALTTAALAFGGMFLLLKPLAPMLGITAGSFTTLGAALTAARAVIAIAGRGILVALGPLGWLIAAILLAWESGLVEWASKLNVFGNTVGGWAQIMANNVVNEFERMWIRTKQFFGFISAGAADAQIAAGKAGREAGVAGHGASGDWARGASGDWESPGRTPKTAEEKRIAAQLAANKAAAAGLGGGGGSNRFKNYDANLDDAKNEYRLAEDELKRHMKVQDSLYKADKISIADYYDDKIAQLRKSTADEIIELEKQQAAYRRQGDKAGVNRTATDITLKKRGLADAEQSVEVEREKDLNALKEKGLALDAQQLQAEGKKNQSILANTVQRLEKDKESYLLNKRYAEAGRAQDAIDTAKLTAALDEYGVELKQVQDATKTGEEQIAGAVKSGAMSSISSADALYALRKKESAQLDELLAKYRALILASDAPNAVKAEKLKSLNLEQAKADTMRNEMSPAMANAKQTLDSSLEGGFSTLFKSIITGSQTASQAFKQFGNSIMATVADLVSKELGKELFKSIFGEGGVPAGLFAGGGLLSGLFGGGGGGASGGGLLGGLFGSMFGGGSASGMATNSAGMAAGQGVSSDFLANMMQFGVAAGGPINGVGPKGVDSVPIYAAPGEHMLTAAEVDAAGGHAAIYAMRAAISAGQSFIMGPPSSMRTQGFANGGAIGGSTGALASMRSDGVGNSQRPVHVTINQHFAPGTSRTSMDQAAVQGGIAVQRALRRNT